MTASRPSPTRACYATALRKASRRITALYDEALAPVGLRSTQHAILVELAAAGPSTINELARSLVLDRSGLGHTLRPLQRDGLIRLDRSSADRRSVEVSLTRAGHQRLGEAAELWRSAQDRVEAAFGVSDIGELRGQLIELAENEYLNA